MKTCQVCGYKENKDNSKFCKQCGAKLEEKEMKQCYKCGQMIAVDKKFCTQCGAEQSAQEEAAYQEEIGSSEAVVSKKKKKKRKRKVILFLLLVIVIVFAAIYWFWGKDYLQKNTRKEKEAQKKTEKTEEEDTKKKKEEEELAYDTRVPVSVRLKVSSTENSGDFDADYLQDANADTAWAVSGDGVGEYVKFEPKEEKKIYGILMLPGKLSSEEEFKAYSYPKKLLISADGEEFEAEMIADEYIPDFENLSHSFVYYEFDEPLESDEIKVSIKAVENGSEYDITVISELYLYTHPKESEKEESSEIVVEHSENGRISQVDAYSDYILPGSDTRYITKEELDGFTAEECRLARNEIYARHGRIFDDEALQFYFESRSWYEAKIQGEEFEESMLNEYEIANRDLIVEYENDQGYQYASTPEEAFQNYMVFLIQAINSGDYTDAGVVMVEGSSLYNEQKSLVDRLYNENTREELISCNVQDQEEMTETSVQIISYEEIKVLYDDGSDKIIQQTYRYTCELTLGGWRLSKIETV